MNDADIIKAKELLQKLEEAYNAYYDTSKCMPYDIDTTIRETAICLERSIDEINRQKADYLRLEKSYIKNQEIFADQCLENERLKAEKEALIAGQETLQKYIAEQKAEIERLQKANERFEKEFDSYYARVKFQAYDEFAERLKLRVESIPWCECKPVQNAIDELAKELKEGVNNA